VKYEDVNCGTKVTLPDGSKGKVAGYDANFGMSLGGNSGGFQRRSTRGLKARVTIAGKGEVEVLISRLKKA
jgi:hypothetical protein